MILLWLFFVTKLFISYFGLLRLGNPSIAKYHLVQLSHFQHCSARKLFYGLEVGLALFNISNTSVTHHSFLCFSRS